MLLYQQTIIKLKKQFQALELLVEGIGEYGKSFLKQVILQVKLYWDEAQPYKKEIEDLVDTFAFDEWPHKLLIPAYDGGNYEALGLKAKEITNWDPSPHTNSYLNDPKGVDLFSQKNLLLKKKKHGLWLVF